MVVIAVLTAGVVGVFAAHGSAGRGASDGGIFRVSFQGLDNVDPALAYDLSSWALLDTTCARLMTYPDRPPPEGYRLRPEVAVAPPRISNGGKTYTFTLRNGFRFSDGAPVRASAFARAINRTLAPGVESGGAAVHERDRRRSRRPGGEDPPAAAGVVARGNTLTDQIHAPRVRLRGEDHDAVLLRRAARAARGTPKESARSRAPARTYVADYRPGERVVPPAQPLLRRDAAAPRRRLRRRPARCLEVPTCSTSIERGEADWGRAIPHRIPGHGPRPLVARYGVNRSQFFVKPGLTLRYAAFNMSRPLFRDNPSVAPRRELRARPGRRCGPSRVSSSPQLFARLTDQHLPHKPAGLP